MNVHYLGTIARIKQPPFYLEYFFRPNCRFFRIRRWGGPSSSLPPKEEADNEPNNIPQVIWGIHNRWRPPNTTPRPGALSQTPPTPEAEKESATEQEKKAVWETRPEPNVLFQPRVKQEVKKEPIKEKEGVVVWGTGLTKKPSHLVPGLADNKTDEAITLGGPRPGGEPWENAKNLARMRARMQKTAHKKVKPKLRTLWDTSPIWKPRQGTPLHWAVDPWKKEEALLILSKGVLDINTKNQDGQTALHLVATQDQPEAARTLLDFGADVNATDDQGFTPIHVAARYKTKRVMAVLLEAEPNLEARDITGETAIYIATRKNAAVLVAMLLDAGAQMAPLETGTTLIHFTTRLRRKAILRMFLERSPTPDVNAAEPDGTTALHIAASQDQHMAAYILLKNGANPNAQDEAGRTPLHLAVEGFHSKTVAVLCQMGADPRIQNDDGNIPDRDVVKVLENKTIKGLEGLVKPIELVKQSLSIEERQKLMKKELAKLKTRPKMGKGKNWDLQFDALNDRRRKKRQQFIQFYLATKAANKLNKKSRWEVRGHITKPGSKSAGLSDLPDNAL